MAVALELKVFGFSVDAELKYIQAFDNHNSSRGTMAHLVAKLQQQNAQD